MKRLGIILLLVTVVFACGKKNNSPKSPEGEKLFTFNGLKADFSDIKQGDVTNITADITGDAKIQWSATAGDVFGSGKVVLFGASTCCTGNHDVTCTVSDANNNSESKTISIYVR